MDDLDDSATTERRRLERRTWKTGVERRWIDSDRSTLAIRKGFLYSGRGPRMPPWLDPSQENSQGKIQQKYYYVSKISTQKLDFVRCEGNVRHA